MPDEIPVAPEGEEDGSQNPHELTTRGVYLAASASLAVLPSPMVHAVIANAKTKQTSEGLWLFEQTSRINTDNLVMKLVPRNEKYFEERTPYARPEEFTNLRLAIRDLGNAAPHSSACRMLARIYGWPTLLYVWTDGEAIYLRKAFTEEVWAQMALNVVADQRYILAHKGLFGLLPSTR